MAKLNI